MTIDTILKLINEVRAEAGEQTIESVGPDSKLRSLGLDSLDLAVLIVKIESRFGVDVFADGVVETVGEVAEKVDGR